jgi:hypothetical protein
MLVSVLHELRCGYPEIRGSFILSLNSGLLCLLGLLIRHCLSHRREALTTMVGIRKRAGFPRTYPRPLRGDNAGEGLSLSEMDVPRPVFVNLSGSRLPSATVDREAPTRIERRPDG